MSKTEKDVPELEFSEKYTTDTPVSAAALVQMGRQPGPFVLALDGQTDPAALLDCYEVVRAIPGRRLVCRGAWRGRDVFIKLYLDGGKHWQVECRGLQALADKGIAAPAVLHTGTADCGALHVIVLEAIQPAETLETALSQAHEEAARIALLQQAIVCIASHHCAGLEQRDIHLNNFLLAGECLYTLDGGGIHDSGSAELSVAQSRDNLALFFAELYPDDDVFVDRVLPVYLQRRSWGSDDLSVATLRQRISHFRDRRLRRFLKKVFRDCSAFIGEHSWRSFRVYDRTLDSAEMVKFLADSLEAKDHYTSRHSQKVSEYSSAIANVMGVSDKEKETLRHASLLHDIGKIGISELIFNKPDKLNDTEYDTIKSHPARGEEIIKPLGFLEEAIRHIRGHHESFDGSGYPDGLGGDDLPLLTKIMTVADSFDAMTSERTYRPPRKTNNAILELKRMSGKQFDPDVVDAFASSEIIKMKSDLDTNK